MAEDFASYWLEIGLPLPFVDSDEDEFIYHVRGTITRESEARVSTEVGTISAFIVNVADAYFGHGMSLFDVLDQDLIASQYMALVGEDGQLLESLGDCLFIDRLLVLERITIYPEHRGHTIGLWAARRLIDALGGSSVLPVLMPHPLQFSPGSEEARESLAGLPEDRRQSFAKIRALWGSLGFEKAAGEGDTEVWVLDPAKPEVDLTGVLNHPRDLP